MGDNKPMVAALIGALSTVPAEILTRVLVSMGIGKFSVYQLDSLLITFNRPTSFMGMIVNFIAGGSVAVLFYYAVEKIGQDYLVYKSTFIGALVWLIYELVFTSTVEGKFFGLRPVSDYYVHLIGAITFGITLGLLFNRYLFKKHTTA